MMAKQLAEGTARRDVAFPYPAMVGRRERARRLGDEGQMSETFPHLERAPITEAVLNVLVDLRPGTSVESIVEAMRTRVRDRFPLERPIMKMAAQLVVGQAGPPPTTTSGHGTLC